MLASTRIYCQEGPCTHSLLGQEMGTACGQSGGSFIWREAFVAAMDAGEWPAQQEPPIQWSCHLCPYTWKGGLHDITDCCGLPVRDVILHHIDVIASKLCKSPPLEIQGQLPKTITIREATSIILSPHGRSLQGLVGEAWDLHTVYHANPSCSCIYDKTTIQMDMRQFDPVIEQTDTGNSDQSWETVAGAAAKGVEQDRGEVMPTYNDGLFTNIHDDGGLVLKGGYPYDPSISLTPSGFHGKKNLTIQKMSMFPDYYNHLRKTLPWSVFLPQRDEGLAKETVCLTLIIEAHQNGLIDLSNDLQHKLHPELKDLSLTVMKHRLAHLVEDAENDPIAKIKPDCPYEAGWVRNQGNNPGFRAWREQYDETYSAYKGNAKTGGCNNPGSGETKGTNVRQKPNNNQQGKSLTKTLVATTIINRDKRGLMWMHQLLSISDQPTSLG